MKRGQICPLPKPLPRAARGQITFTGDKIKACEPLPVLAWGQNPLFVPFKLYY